jgi:hypothetical protein
MRSFKFGTKISLAVVAFVCAVPSGLADPIFMSAGADRVSVAYLVVGNLVAALFESFAIAKVFRTPFKRTLLWMILANYVSTFVGYVSMDCMIRIAGPLLFPDIPYNLPFVFIVLLGSSFVFAVLYEWPFLIKLFNQRKSAIKTALRASLLAQIISYSILVPCYLYSADTTWFQHMHRDALFIKSEHVVVYYIDPSGSICKLTLPRLTPEVVSRVNAIKGNRLSVKYDGDHWQLWRYGADNIPHLILNNIGGSTRLVQGPEIVDVQDGVQVDFVNGFNDQLLNRVGKHYWGDVMALTVDIPFIEPYIFPVFLLPDEQAVLSWHPCFGRLLIPFEDWRDRRDPKTSQLFLVDLKTKELARIGRSNTFVVVADRKDFGNDLEWNGMGIGHAR